MMACAPTNLEKPLIVFAGGGTGGHLYPAIALLGEIRRLKPKARFVFFSSSRSIDRQVLDHADCEFVPQTLRPASLAPWRALGAIQDFRRGCDACRRSFLSDRPAIVLGTGGLASVPAINEAVRLGIPTVLFNPDAWPGKANQYLAAMADAIFVQFPKTVAHLPHCKEVIVTGCPVRPAFLAATRDSGLRCFGLNPNRRVLLITGASQGARSVNQAVIVLAEFLAAQSDWQVLHLTGQADYDSVSASYAKFAESFKVVAYTEQMAEAMAAADLMISRAGASTLAEIMAVGRASILMPYPFHKDRHQWVNAECLADAGGARIVADRIEPAETAPALRDALDELLHSEDIRRRMAAAARNVSGGANPAVVMAELVLDRIDRRCVDARVTIDTRKAKASPHAVGATA